MEYGVGIMHKNVNYEMHLNALTKKILKKFFVNLNHINPHKLQTEIDSDVERKYLINDRSMYLCKYIYILCVIMMIIYEYNHIYTA